MAIITLGSLGHSPGTTTTAVALTSHWPRSAMLIEADPNTTSAVLAGRFRGQIPHRIGLTNLSSAATHSELDPALLWANSIELAPDRRIVPGFSSLGAARGAESFWAELLPVLTPLDAAGTDIIVDLGRFDADDARSPLVAAAQLVVVTSGTALPDIAATTAPTTGRNSRLRDLTTFLADVGHTDVVRLALIERAGENYAASEIRRVAGVPIVGSLPYSPEGAATYSLGASGSRRGRRAAYERAVATLVEASQRAVTDHDRRIGVPRHDDSATAAEVTS